MKKIILLSLIATGLSGCAGYTPRLNVDEKPAETDAFFYGRFHITTNKPVAILDLSMDGYPSMGFGIKCNDGAHYLLRFYKDNPVSVVKIKPSVCSLTEIVYSDTDGIVVGRKPFNKPFLQNMQIKPGFAYYLGDFEAKMTYSSTYNKRTSEWQISNFRINFGSTTLDMQSRYPNISKFAVENMTRP